MRTTEQLAAAAEARQAAIAQLNGLLETTTGTAEDYDGTVAAEVDARGALRQLWLADNATCWGHQRLGELIVEVAQTAARDATQRAFTAMALPLGDTVTAAIEGLGPPVPARSAGMDTGSRITPEEFQARRDRERSAGQPDPPTRTWPTSMPRSSALTDESLFSVLKLRACKQLSVLPLRVRAWRRTSFRSNSD